MDQLVGDIRRLSSEGDFKALATQLQTSSDQINQMDKAVLDTVIDCLDVKSHSLGVMAAL